jgi:hypothetical protein
MRYYDGGVPFAKLEDAQQDPSNVRLTEGEMDFSIHFERVHGFGRFVSRNANMIPRVYRESSFEETPSAITAFEKAALLIQQDYGNRYLWVCYRLHDGYKLKESRASHLGNGSYQRFLTDLTDIEEALSDDSLEADNNATDDPLSVDPDDDHHITLEGLSQELASSAGDETVLASTESDESYQVTASVFLQAVEVISNHPNLEVTSEGVLLTGALVSAATFLWRYKSTFNPLGALAAGLGVLPAAASDACSLYDSDQGFDHFLSLSVEEQLTEARHCPSLVHQVLAINEGLSALE